MVFQSLELTTALRPDLLPDETLLFVQDAVGLYEGKYKLPNYQNGHVYLTSHRICYVDNNEPRRNSTAVHLKEIEKYDYAAGFLKSSAKVTLYPKARKRASLLSSSFPPHHGSPHLSPAGSQPPSRAESRLSGAGPSAPAPSSQAVTWICPICSFPNTLHAGFDATTANEQTPLQPCQTCGIKPPLAHLLKAAIASATSRTIQGTSSSPMPTATSQAPPLSVALAQRTKPVAPDTIVCQRCTFLNHSSLSACEMCGAPIQTSQDPRTTFGYDQAREDSPGPVLNTPKTQAGGEVESVKFSFRTGGDKVFYDRLKGAMVQRKWLSDRAPPVPIPTHQHSGLSTPSRSETATPTSKGVGIAGLERLGIDRRRNNETVISGAFEDLEALMASAQKIIDIAESFSDKSSEKSASKIISDAALGMATTRDKLDSNSGSETLYLSELSRTLAEYLTDDKQGILKREGGIMSLVDLWAAFNRARNGVELVSPSDFERAARLWGGLSLPVRLREFKSGLLVVQRHDWTDEKTIGQVLSWLGELHSVEYIEQAQWDQESFGRGITAQEAATKFGWSVGVATEELEMAEENGALCREEGIEGLKFWENWIIKE